MFIFVLFLLIGIVGVVGGAGAWVLAMFESDPEKYADLLKMIPFKVSDYFADLSKLQTYALIAIGVGFFLIILNVILIKKAKKKRKAKKNSAVDYSKNVDSEEDEEDDEEPIDWGKQDDSGITYNGKKCSLRMKVREGKGFATSWENKVNTILNRGYNVIDNFGYEIGKDLWMEFSSNLSASELKAKEKNPDNRHIAKIEQRDARESRTFKVDSVYGFKPGSSEQVYDGGIKRFTRDYFNTYSLMINGKHATYSNRGYTYRVDVEYRHIEPDGSCPVFMDKNLFPDKFKAMFFGAGFNCYDYRYASSFQLKDGTIITEIGLQYGGPKKQYGDDATVRRVFESSDNHILVSYVRKVGYDGANQGIDRTQFGFELCEYDGGYFLGIGKNIDAFADAYDELKQSGKEYLCNPENEAVPLVARIAYNGDLYQEFDWSFHKALAEEISDRHIFAEDSMKVIINLLKSKDLKKIVKDYFEDIFYVNLDE